MPLTHIELTQQTVATTPAADLHPANSDVRGWAWCTPTPDGWRCWACTQTLCNGEGTLWSEAAVWAANNVRPGPEKRFVTD